MTLTIAAIPTTYAGVRFRSRLEARWAATFDLLGWEWAYEPYDLNGWIPDFVLTLPKYNESPNCKFDQFYGVPHIRVQHPFVEVRPVEDHPASQRYLLEGFGVDRIYKGLGITFKEVPSDMFEGGTETIIEGGEGNEVLLLGNNPDNAWRIPDLGDWTCPENLFIHDNKKEIWKAAGNKVQWRG
jgi:hypothetical protein